MNRIGRLFHRGALRHEDGQVLAIVAGGMFVIIAMVGLVIDGGYAWGRQRETQNGADSTSKAGAVVILQWLDGESKTAGDVRCAVERLATETDVELEDVQFTRFDGSLFGPVPDCTSTDAIHEDVQGVKVVATQEFRPFIMSAVGFGDLTARADAIAVVGPLVGTTAVLPVTFPQTMGVCDDSGRVYTVRNWDQGNVAGGPKASPGVWDPYEILPSTVPPDAGNLAIVPLCSTGPGSVGWLEFGCGNLSETIANPCDVFFTIPDWIQTQTGNVNSLEDELALYFGNQPGFYEPETDPDDLDPDVKVKLPIHRSTCEEDAGVSDMDGDGNPDLNPCPDGEWTAGEGNNLFYGVDFWVGFVLDSAHVQGNDVECQPPTDGEPQLENPTGWVGCLKGWFVTRIGRPDEVSIGDINPGDNEDLGVTLIN